jgi:hypothetical protein
MIVKYALVQNDKIIKFRNIDDADTHLIGKLVAHGYMIVEETTPPAFDSVTQSLSDQYEIQTDKVARIWKVIERPFNEAKQMKEDMLKLKTMDQISESLDLPAQKSLIEGILSTRTISAADIKNATTNQDIRDIII